MKYTGINKSLLKILISETSNFQYKYLYNKIMVTRNTLEFGRSGDTFSRKPSWFLKDEKGKKMERVLAEESHTQQEQRR